MYYLELYFSNGQAIRLPEPYLLWSQAQEAALKRFSAEYTVVIVQD